MLGPDPFGPALERTFAGRTERGRGFELHRAATLAQLPECHIVFVASTTSAERRAALDELRKQSVLTVGDAPEFLAEGGIVRFQVTDYVEMSINLDQARASSLIIPTRVLEVSREVLDHGVLRRAR